MHERLTPTAERRFERDPLRNDTFRTAIGQLLSHGERITRGVGHRPRIGRLVEPMEIALREYLTKPTADPVAHAEAERLAAHVAIYYLRTTIGISNLGSEVSEWPSASSHVDIVASLLHKIAEATGGPEDNELARSVALQAEQLFYTAINDADTAGIRLAYDLYDVQAEAEETGVSELVQSMHFDRGLKNPFGSIIAHWVGCAIANRWPTEEPNLSVPCVLIWNWLDAFWVADQDL